MSRLETFQFTVDEHAAQLTEQSHQTIYWLARNGYMEQDDLDDLLNRMVVVPIRNHRSFGRRILDRFFNNSDSTEHSFVFPITLLEEPGHGDNLSKPSGKPNLTVV